MQNTYSDRVNKLREELREVIMAEAIFHGDFTLSSGQKSTYYIDCRLVTLSPRGAWLVGNLIFEMLKDAGVDAIGGPTLGADPIATAVAVASYEGGRPIPAFIVRKEAKAHGGMGQIEGPLPKKQGAKVVIVEDVVTTAGSVVKAIDAVRARGLEVVRAIALVDRLQGGREALAEVGCEFAPIFTIDELGV